MQYHKRLNGAADVRVQGTTGLKDLSDPLGFEEISNRPLIGILTTQSSMVTIQKYALRGYKDYLLGEVIMKIQCL